MKYARVRRFFKVVILQRNPLISVSEFSTRGVIRHQGEADNTGSTTQANYATRLNGVIDYTQSYFNTHLKWVISRVSYVSGVTKAAITGAQLDVKTGTNASYTSTGAWDSDIITARSGGLHFNASGLVKLNNKYHTSSSSGNTYTALQALTPIPAIISNQLTVVKKGYFPQQNEM